MIHCRDAFSMYGSPKRGYAILGALYRILGMGVVTVYGDIRSVTLGRGAHMPLSVDPSVLKECVR